MMYSYPGQPPREVPPPGQGYPPPTQQMGGMNLGPSSGIPPPLANTGPGYGPPQGGVPTYGQPFAPSGGNFPPPSAQYRPPQGAGASSSGPMHPPSRGLQNVPLSQASGITSGPTSSQQLTNGPQHVYSEQMIPVSGQGPMFSGQRGPQVSMGQMTGQFQPPTSAGQSIPTPFGHMPQFSGQMVGPPPPSGQMHGPPPPSGQMTGPPPPSGQMTGPPPPSGQMTGPPPPSGQMTGPPPPPGQMHGPSPPSRQMGLGPPPSMMPPTSGPPPSMLGPPPPTSFTQPPGMVPPSTGHPGMMPPSTGHPGMMPPSTGHPGMMPPSTGHPGMMPPSGGHPGMMPPSTGHPGMMPPSGGHPGMMPPSTGHPGMMPPSTGHPGMMSPSGGHPGMMPPSTGHPGMMPPSTGHPGMMPPSTGHPGMMPPSTGHPGMMPPSTGHPGMMPSGMSTAPIQQQPRTRIDPDQMPNPVVVMKMDQEQRGCVPFLTSTRGIPPPLVTTNYTVQDDGNCSPRYMRATLYTVPCTKDLLNSCRIPMGLVVQAFADVPQNENMLRIVDHGSLGPVRCNRCKAYMNPFARFIDGGRQYLCPICQCSNEVPPEYFCHLDHQGRRTDTLQRPELSFGSVEYIATKDYCKEGKLPKPPAYIFMIDVSFANVQSGLLGLLSQTILDVLESLPGSTEEGGSPIQVGFVTYDQVIHFYNIKANLAQPQMMVLTDISDVFVPIVDGFLVNASEATTVLESLLSQLPEMFSGNKSPQVIFEPVVRAGMEAIKAAECNGRLFIFQSSLPTAQGPGMLKNRVDSKLLGTDKEKTLLSPASSSYGKLAEECVKYGVSVELFLFPSAYCDVATLGHLVHNTGGEIHLYKNYQTSRDGDRLIKDLKYSISRKTAFDAVMRVRASTGLRPTGFFGAFFMSNTTDIELANIDSDKAIAVEIKHDDKLREDEMTFFQAALLFTDFRGERRLRIHNLALNCSTKYQDIYRSCEVDTIMNFFSKSITHASLSMPYKNIRENFSHQCAVILACYRKHCSTQSPAGQLILPESLKLLPMYANCLLKSDALLSPSAVLSLDEKCWLMYSMLAMNVRQSVTFLYPRMFSLHDLDVEGRGLPPVMRCTGQKLQDTGVYCIENGVTMVIYIGQHAPPEFVSKVFAWTAAQSEVEMHSLPALDNPLSFRVRGIVNYLQAQRECHMQLIVTRQRTKAEVVFRRLLKEDKGPGQWEGTSYVDFLCQVHRDIKEILS